VAALDSVTAAAGGGFLEVEPGAEGAAPAGQDRNRTRRIGIEAAKSSGERLGGGAIDGIARRRALDRDDGDRAVRFKRDGRRFAHRRGLSLRRITAKRRLTPSRNDPRRSGRAVGRRTRWRLSA